MGMGERMPLSIGDKLGLVCMPKCGTTFASVVFEESGAGSRDRARQAIEGLGLKYNGHELARNIPDSVYLDRRWIGLVRDPWSWALSYYFHFRGDSWSGDGTRYLSQFHKSGNAASVIRGMFTPEAARGRAMGWDLTLSFPPISAPWDDLEKAGDLWTYLVKQFYQDGSGNWIVDELVYLSDIRTRLGYIFDGYGYNGDVPRGYNPANVSGRYTAEYANQFWSDRPGLWGLVEERTAEMRREMK